MIGRRFWSSVIRRVAVSLVISAVLYVVSHVGSVLAVNQFDPPGTVSGDCVAGFACTGGDPVLCAISIAERSTACVMGRSDKTIQQIVETAGFDKSLGDVATPDSVGVSLGDVPSRSTTCPASFQAQIFGASFDVDLAGLCNVFSVLGWCVLLGSVVKAAFILGGS